MKILKLLEQKIINQNERNGDTFKPSEGFNIDSN